MSNYVLFLIILIYITQLAAENSGEFYAEKDWFPFEVSLRFANDHEHLCGGSILNAYMILTAAHCFYDLTENTFFEVTTVYVYVGSLTEYKQENVYEIETGILHKNFNPDTVKNDIAVIKLKRQIVFSPFIHAVSLSKSRVPPRSTLIVSGWSTPKWSDKKYYKYIETVSLDIEYCKDLTEDDVLDDKTQVCIQHYSVLPCIGDSGSPVLMETDNNELKQVAIVAYGYTNVCFTDLPKVFTKVKPFLPFIRQSIKKLWPIKKAVL